MTYPWEDASQPEHVRNRQTIWNLDGPRIRADLPRRRPAFELPLSLQGVSYGAVIMTHRGYTNGRLSILLSSLPENLPVTVSSDSITEAEVQADGEVAAWHNASFVWHRPWNGRAGHAIQCMSDTSWDYTLFLCDDVWLFPETTIEMLRWTRILEGAGLPVAELGVGGYETYHEWERFGFASWQDCLDHPDRFEALPPHPKFLLAPALLKNPFGACFLIVRRAYDDLGGFAREYWAHDDVFHHRVWSSGRWLAAAAPCRGYLHYGAQSGHFGETSEWIGTFYDATGMSADESGERQYEAMRCHARVHGDTLLRLGGTPLL